METVKKYVVGFLFDKSGNVALIHKNRPDWQRGRLNGIGGHIEIDEAPQEAMNREFKEEAGADLSWRQFCEVKGDSYKLFCFVSKDEAMIQTMTDEKVGWYNPRNLPDNALPNLLWLLPMADYKFDITGVIIHPSEEC